MGAQAARFAWRRIAPGPRTRTEVATMLATSPLLPFLAVYHRARGYARVRRLLADVARAPHPLPPAVLFDRDGTLVVDVAHNGDPALVEAMPGARAALDRLRTAGIATAVVSNQSGVALGRVTREAVDAVNERVDALLGPLGPVLVCPHGPDDGAAAASRKRASSKTPPARWASRRTTASSSATSAPTSRRRTPRVRARSSFRQA